MPYVHVYTCFVKQRWIGRKLLDVLLSEFEALDKEYIQKACIEGNIKLTNWTGHDLYDTTIDCFAILDHVLEPNQRIVHSVYVHEQLALDIPIVILKDNDDYLVASKPCSIPVYKTGTYYYNTLMEILTQHTNCKEGKKLKLYPLHRIDKLVSGIVIFAKHSAAASRFTRAISEGLVEKVYLARVLGNFSKFVESYNDYFIDPNSTNKDEPLLGNVIINCFGYMKPISRKLAQYVFIPNNDGHDCKYAHTRFRFILYNTKMDESLVMCYPVTGRTHQIRAHLLHLGYPISNDLCYNDKIVNTYINDADNIYFKRIPFIHWDIDEDRHWCIPEIDFHDEKPSNLTSVPFHIGLNRKPKQERNGIQSGIYLHAYSYKCPNEFDVSDCIPKWATDLGYMCM